MLIVAHRGYSSRFPENSRLAFEAAIAAGADLIETDLRLTRDGAVVCWHDADLTRESDTRLVIAESSLAQVKAVSLPQGQRILTLAEVLGLARGKVRVMLDVKLDSSALRAVILETVHGAGMHDSVIYGVRSVAHLHAVRAQARGLALIAMPARPALLPEFLGAGVCAVRLWEEDVSEAGIEQARSAGLEVWVTAGLRPAAESPGYITAGRLQALGSLEIDAVLVNDVGLALQVRNARQPST